MLLAQHCVIAVQGNEKEKLLTLIVVIPQKLSTKLKKNRGFFHELTKIEHLLRFHKGQSGHSAAIKRFTDNPK